MEEKTITFLHKGRTINALALYDEKDIQTVLLLLPEDLVNDLDESVLFLKDKNNCWKTASYIEQAYPETVENIISALNELCKQTKGRKKG